MSGNWKERYGGAALITGASAGLGAEFARQLATKGMDLVLVARRREALESLSKQLSDTYKVKVTVIAQDLQALDCADRIRQETDRAGVTVGLLVNNAGFGSHGFFHELDHANEARMVDVNCRAPVALSGKYIPDMVQRRKGAVIFLASVAAYQPDPYFAVYGATKTFALMMGEALWAELRPFGVDVIALSPGYTRTEFQETAAVKAKPLAGWKNADEVVRRALNKLGKKPSTIPGFRNWFLAWNIRFTPRRLAAMISKGVNKPG